MPTSDNQNTGFTPAVWQTQDPVIANDQNQTSAFDFSLDLPDSFPAASNTVAEETSALEQQTFPSAEEPVSENVPTVEEVSAPVDTGMDFLHEEPVAQEEDSSLEESAEVALGPSQEDIVSVEEMPLPSSDFSLEQEDTMPSYSSDSTQMVSDAVEENSVQATSQEAVPASLQMPPELPTSFVQKEEESQTLTSVSSGEEDVNIPSTFVQPQESVQTSASFVSQIPASEPVASYSAPEPAPVMQDPFEAMRTSLNQNLTPEPVAQESTPVSQSLETPVAQVVSPSSEKPMGMLSLDEMIAQPVAAPAPTMNLDAMMGASAPVVANPLSNPVAYPSITQPQPAQNKVSALVAVFGVFALIVAVGFMAFLKYPDEIQQMFGLGGGAVPAMQMAQLTGEQEHGAAELTGEVMTGSTADDATDTSETEESADLGEVTIDEKQAETSDDVQEVVLGDASSDAEESTTEIKSEESQNSTVISGNTLSDPVDALGAVEGIVGEVSANETLTQQVENFKLKAQQIADAGKAQGNRMMLKYGIYVVNQVKKVQDDLANGQKMSISEWNALKSELELSLAKAQNGGN